MIKIGRISPSKNGLAKIRRQIFPNKMRFHYNDYRFSKRARAGVAVLIVILVLISLFVLIPKNNPAPVTPDPTATPTISPSVIPKENSSQSIPIVTVGPRPIAPNPTVSPTQPPKQPGTIETAQTINSSTWQAIAVNAWKYYEPNTGVDQSTGLPYTGASSPYFTDWDLGVYIQAVIDAQKLNLIDDNSTWGFNDRINKVLTWLETRELNNGSYPYWFYQAYDGAVWHQNSDTVPADHIDLADTGRLLVALNNLREYSQFTNRVNNLVYNADGNRSDYSKQLPGIKAGSLTSVNIYGYYTTSGFEAFWLTQLSGASNKILDNILSANKTVTNESVVLPMALISGDPLLSAVFEFKNPDARLLTIANMTFNAHEAYYNSRANLEDKYRYRAFGEGPSFSTDWQWEWVVFPDGRTWIPLNGNSQPTGVTPMIYTKIALGFLAIHNDNYTKSMAIYLEHNLPDPTQGYCEGIDEGGSAFTALGSLTNGLILDAATYYIRNNP
jgi:hypothetical protein